jgi:NAD(P)-dependent dehydrogenase (short-subunit alcohol dehydrogenase family)
VERHDRESDGAGDRRQPGHRPRRGAAVARDGFDVVVHCRSRIEEAQSVVADIQALGRQARVLMFDIAERDATAAALLADVEAKARLLLRRRLQRRCRARHGAFPAMTGEEWDAVYWARTWTASSTC